MSLPESTLSWLGVTKAISAVILLTTVYTFSVMSCHLMYYSSSDISRDVGFGDAQCYMTEIGRISDLVNRSSPVDDNCTSLKLKGVCELHSEEGCNWTHSGSGLDVQLLSGLGYDVTYAMSSVILIFVLNTSKLKNVNRVYCICMASSLTSACLVGMAFSQSYWQLVSLRLFMGFCSSIIRPMVTSVVVGHFKKTPFMSFMTSVVGFGIYIGGGLANTTLQLIGSSDAYNILGKSSWRSAYLLTSIPSFVSMFLSLFFVREAKLIIDECEIEVMIAKSEENITTVVLENIDVAVLVSKDQNETNEPAVEEGGISSDEADGEGCCDVEQKKLITSQVDDKSDNISMLSRISKYSSNILSSITTLNSPRQTSIIPTATSSDLISITTAAPRSITDVSYLGLLRNVLLKDRTFVSLVIAVGVRNMGPCVWLYNIKNFYLNHIEGSYQLENTYTTVLTLCGSVSLAVTGVMGDLFLKRFGMSSLLWILTVTSFLVDPFCFLAVHMKPSTSIWMFGVNLLIGEGWLIIFFSYVSSKFDDHRLRSSAFAVVICSIQICGGIFPLVYEWLSGMIGASKAMYICFPGMNTLASMLFLMIAVSDHKKSGCCSKSNESND